VEHYPPDTKAGETWLFNRQPDKWKRQRDADKDPDRELTIKIKRCRPASLRWWRG
jgi:hypothetical protein